MPPRKLACTYSSGLIIEDPKDLATLAVFYDEIVVPECPEVRDDGPIVWIASYRRVVEWDVRFRALYDAELLRRPEGTFRADYVLHPHVEALPVYEQVVDDYEELFIFRHGRRSDVIHPELFISKPTHTSANRVSGFLVRSLFELRLPRLSELNAEQILDVRYLVKDNKEGFTDYVATLTDDVEARIKGGESEMDAARAVAERKLVPYYNEFRRQLEAKKGGWWGRVLEAGGEFMSIDAGPLTPKFYGAAIQAAAKLFRDGTDRISKDLTNKGQAFQWLAKVEKGLDG